MSCLRQAGTFLYSSVSPFAVVMRLVVVKWSAPTNSGLASSRNQHPISGFRCCFDRDLLFGHLSREPAFFHRDPRSRAIRHGVEQENQRSLQLEGLLTCGRQRFTCFNLRSSVRRKKFLLQYHGLRNQPAGCNSGNTSFSWVNSNGTRRYINGSPKFR